MTIAKHYRPAAPGTACEYSLDMTASLTADASRPFSRPGDNAIPDQIFCEIQSGHPGPHLAQMQAFGDDEAWAEWAPGTTAVVKYFSSDTLCEATGRAVDYQDDDDALCELPTGHYGAHSFSLRHADSAGRDPSPEKAALLAQMTDEPE